ncbi:hypothetical protein [Dactylosporangium sp. CA-092794]|uniref:hypothetical protein n=1 Tax=Dactylosporangium sp. CA-092794 TaxID=3239929 RepID=UPI003D9143C0
MTQPPRQTLEHPLDPGSHDLGPHDPEATQPLPPPPPREHHIHRPPALLIALLAAGVVLAGALLAVLIGRIDREPAAAAESPPQRFPSPQALVDYLDRRGLECTGYEAVEGAGNALGQGRCTAAGAEVGIGVYAAHSDVEAQWTALSGRRVPLYMAIGDNWAVDGPAEWTKRVAEALNAQYRVQG